MKTVTLQQGSPEWLAHRRTTRNASDAPAMMGASPYVSRAELLRQRATGVDREIDAATQARFDRGHEVEPALRVLAEDEIGEDLYPVTGVADDGYMGASFDGVTLAEDTLLEAKQPNAEKAACIARGEIPPADYWQLVQQFAVCDSATRCLYLVGDGTDEGTARLWIERSAIAHDIPKLIAGWRQFDADLAAYVPEAPASPSPTGRAPDQLPALHIEVTGMVTASNLREWRDAAIAVFKGISADLETDQDFADAEKTVKWCEEIESQLKAAKQHALSQTASIDELFRTIDAIADEARSKRLQLDKKVKVEKENRKAEIVLAGAKAVRAHYDQINTTLGEHRIQPPQSLQMDLGAAIKGKKSLASMKDAVDAAVATAKIAGSQQAERVRQNAAVLAEVAGDFGTLFPDRVVLCATKQPEDLQNLVAARIADHQQREAERLQRERAHAESAPQLNTTQRAIETVQQPSAVGRGVDGSTGELRAAGEPGIGIAKPPASTARIKLGDINSWIAPLSITAEGLATLGFKPVGNQGAAKLYAANDFPVICTALIDVVGQATARMKLKVAA